MRTSKRLFLACIFLCIFHSSAFAGEIWKITGYDACKKCCGKSQDDPAYGITASGKTARVGYVACNWLRFGTRIEISGMGVYQVQDRGAKRYFGDKNNHIKHLDIYFETHEQARQFGVQYREVTILE